MEIRTTYPVVAQRWDIQFLLTTRHLQLIPSLFRANEETYFLIHIHPPNYCSHGLNSTPKRIFLVIFFVISCSSPLLSSLPWYHLHSGHLSQWSSSTVIGLSQMIILLRDQLAVSSSFDERLPDLLFGLLWVLLLLHPLRPIAPEMSVAFSNWVIQFPSVWLMWKVSWFVVFFW